MASIGQGGGTPVRVSDSERERTVELLREAWLAGRLSDDELEDRIREAWEAQFVGDLWNAVRELPLPHPPVPPPERFPPAAGWSVGLSGLGAFFLLVSFGLAFMLTLPMGGTGWLLGRQVRRSSAVRGRSVARAGEVIGIVVTLASLLALAGCAAILAVAS